MLVNAQLTTNLTKIIEDKFPGQGRYSTNGLAVNVEYESPTSILLKGALIYMIDFNADLWRAMDVLKTQYGFKIQQIMTSGVGSLENPTDVYILMTK